MTTSNTSGPTVDIHGAADILKVHPETVKEMISSGALPAAKVGRAWVMRTTDVVGIVDRQIAVQTAARMGSGRRTRVTKARRPDRSRAGSRNASSSGGSCAP